MSKYFFKVFCTSLRRMTEFGRVKQVRRSICLWDQPRLHPKDVGVAAPTSIEKFETPTYAKTAWPTARKSGVVTHVGK